MAELFRLGWGESLLYREVTGNSNHADAIVEAMRFLNDVDGKILTLYGHGGSHHFTYGLVSSVMGRRISPFLYVHIDQHTDAGRAHPDPNRSSKQIGLSCGAFVREIEKLGAKSFLYVGTEANCGGGTLPYVRQRNLINGNTKKVMLKKLQARSCNDTYVSIDLDVLAQPEVATGYARGKLTLENLLEVIEIIQEQKNILGADVLGFSVRALDYDEVSSHKHYEEISFLTYAIIASKFIGRDYQDFVKVRNSYMKKNKRKTK